jgi:hypothetical protein
MPMGESVIDVPAVFDTVDDEFNYLGGNPYGDGDEKNEV